MAYGFVTTYKTSMAEIPVGVKSVQLVKVIWSEEMAFVVSSV